MSARFWVASRKGLFDVRERAGRWSIAGVHFLGDAVNMLASDPRDGALYAALSHGHFGSKLQRSRDGGRTWREIAAPSYPERPADSDDVDPVRQTPLEWKLKDVWELAPGGPDQPGRLWCGTIPGGLFRSDDHGDSWQLVRSLWDMPERRRWFGGGADLPGIHSVCVNPRDSRDVTVGVSCGGVWRSFDDGATWESRAQGMRAAFMPPEQAYDPLIQDPHRLAQCAAAPDVLWAQHHNGIFKTTDGGRAWTEIEEAGPAVFGFPVVAHPEDAQTAWFVPAQKDEQRYPVGGRVAVTRTRDGGRSFDVLSEGLPQEHAYDLVYRHALDLSRSGERLAFGSTTGSVWASNDQGDSWTAVSEHLPPVYCVRFEA